MSERYQTLTVELYEGRRADELEGLMRAIRHMQGVADVRLGTVVDFLERRAAARELREKVWDMLTKEIEE